MDPLKLKTRLLKLEALLKKYEGEGMRKQRKRIHSKIRRLKYILGKEN